MIVKAIISSTFAASLLLCALAQQGTAQILSTAQNSVATKVDEIGRLRHCDFTARLDNLAIELQNDPSAQAYLLAFDANSEKYPFSRSVLRTSRHYLVEVRGIEPQRVVTVIAGNRDDIKQGVLELWQVPASALPPAFAPTTNKYTDSNFRGMFDSFAADEEIYETIVEMGYTSEGISRSEFASKLKQQSESIGYVVIRPGKNALPGAWRRISRREEQILKKDYDVDVSRLKAVEGEDSEDYTQIEFWVLSASEQPPARSTPKVEKPLSSTVRVNVLDFYGTDETEAEAEKWVFDNLVEVLLANPTATGYLILREREEPEEAADEGQLTDVNGETSTDMQEEPESSSSGETAEEDGAPEESEETEAEDKDRPETVRELAEEWKAQLSKQGIDSSRIVILEGSGIPWGVDRIETWLVPKGASPPDPRRKKEEFDDPN